MQFKAKVIHPDPPPADDAGELELPDELAVLGDQLRDDAAHLVEVYPAEFYDRVMESELAVSAVSQDAGYYVTRAAAEKRKARLRTFSVVASVLVIFVATPLTLLLVMQPNDVPATVNAPEKSAPLPSPAPVNSLAADVPQPLPQDIPAFINTGPAAFGNVQEVMFIHKAPGPKLDAWLDALESEDPEITLLSM